MAKTDQFYRAEADYLLRENMNKLKGLIDLLALGALESLSEKEQDELIGKIKIQMDKLYDQLEQSIFTEPK